MMQYLFFVLFLAMGFLAHANAKSCTGATSSLSQFQVVSCPDGSCQFSLPGASFTQATETPGRLRFVANTGASLTYSRGWISKFFDETYNEFRDPQRIFCERAYQPIWIFTKSRPGCEHARLAIVALPKMYKRFLICATSEAEADAMLAAVELRQLNRDELPENPFKSQELLPELKPQGKHLNSNDEIEQSTLRILVKNPKATINPYLAITMLSGQGYNEHAMAWYGAQFEKGTYAELTDPTLLAFPALKAHEKFPQLNEYALTMADYWSGFEHASTLIIEPKSGQFSSNDLIFGLHGQGSDPEALRRVAQKVANTAGTLVVLQSAGVRFRDARYDWSEFVQHDHLRLEYAESLAVKKWPQLRPKKRLLFGFGQGAQVALQIATSYPERFYGAAAFTPFSAYSDKFVSEIQSERLLGRVFLLQTSGSFVPDLNAYGGKLVAKGAIVETQFKKREPLQWKKTSWLKSWVKAALQSNLDE